MKLVRFKGKKDGSTKMGVLRGEEIVDLSAALNGKAPIAEDLAWYDLDADIARAVKDALAGGSAPVVAQSDATLLAPIARPNKIICIGLNYRDHAIESKMDIPKSPIMFTKFATSIAGPNDNVVIPRGCEKGDYEAEMAVIIGKTAKHISEADALDHVFGYACFNDVSARDFQFADGQWTRGKAADTFAPIGPFVATKDEIADPGNLRIQLRLNGETMQDSNTGQLIFNVPQLVSFLSQSMTLQPGDIIATGTPPGVGFARKPPVYLKAGDRMEVEIEGLGVLVSPVVAAD